jgi:cytoskeletal protein RodZ
MAKTTKKFRTKKISGYLVGEKLKAERLKKNLSLEEAENETKVRVKYLEALENDDYAAFSSDVYAIGFLRRYSDFLGLDSDSLIENHRQFVGKTILRERRLAPERIKYKNNFIITPKLFLGLFIFLAIAGLGAYIYLQIQHFSAPPELSITKPADNFQADIDSITIEGVTSPSATLIINNEQLPPDINGNFQKTIKLAIGLNTIQIISKNRVDKASAKELKIYYEPKVEVPLVPATTGALTSTTGTTTSTP